MAGQQLVGLVDDVVVVAAGQNVHQNYLDTGNFGRECFQNCLNALVNVGRLVVVVDVVEA